jgi:hypothetical protein
VLAGYEIIDAHPRQRATMTATFAFTKPSKTAKTSRACATAADCGAEFDS